ncbi:hypothetical protein MPER_12464 [Moniliophthora perniciosa FA553]|nr:hypothetical protein MPER_12464 [Moniliophthora perniciosa FA553]
MPNEEYSHPQLARDQFECDSDVGSYCVVNDGPVSPPLVTPDENPNSLLLLSTKLDTVITTLHALQKMPNSLVAYLGAKVNALEKQNRQWEIDAKGSQNECALLTDLLCNTQAVLEETKNKLEQAEAKMALLGIEFQNARENIIQLTRTNALLKLTLEEETGINYQTRKERDDLVSTAQLDKVKAELTEELNAEKAKNVSLQAQLLATTSEAPNWKNKYGDSRKEKAIEEPAVLESSQGLASLRQSLVDDNARLTRAGFSGQPEVSNSMEPPLSNLWREFAEPEVRDMLSALQNTSINTDGDVEDLGNEALHAMYLDILRQVSLQVGPRDDSTSRQ